jgi:hypothetical protein
MGSIMEKTFIPLTIRVVDQAVKDWFDKTVAPVVTTNDGDRKVVPTVFSQGERWAIGRVKDGNNGAMRDENGVLMLPIISIRRTSIDTDASQTALGVQTDNITVAKRVDFKTGDLQSLERLKNPEQRLGYDPVVYDVYTIPFPDRVILSYQVVIQTQYIGQMNEVIQKMWRMLDIQKSFVMPIHNDGRTPPRSTGYREVKPLDKPYLVGFFEDAYADSGNFEEMTDSERIVKYTTTFTVPAALSTSPDGTEPLVRVERTAYKVTIPEENVRWVDNPADLDKIFGPER